jgi:hypothetical protein
VNKLTSRKVPFVQSRESDQISRRVSAALNYPGEDDKLWYYCKEITYKKYVNRNLLGFILKIVYIRPRNAFSSIGEHTYESGKGHQQYHTSDLPASVLLPVRVKLVFKAPVPA